MCDFKIERKLSKREQVYWHLNDFYEALKK